VRSVRYVQADLAQLEEAWTYRTDLTPARPVGDVPAAVRALVRRIDAGTRVALG